MQVPFPENKLSTILLYIHDQWREILASSESIQLQFVGVLAYIYNTSTDFRQW